MRRYNILQLIGSFAQGGSESQAVQLTRLLHNERSFNVRLASIDPAGVLRSGAERIGLPPIPSYPLSSFYNGRAALQWARFVRFLRAENIHLVHTHDFYTNVFGMIGAALARVPIRVASRRETGGFRTPAQLRVEHGVYRLAHTIVANAAAVRDQLISEGVSKSRIALIYNGVDASRFDTPAGFCPAAARAALGLPPEGPAVTIVANLNSPVKDHVTFLRAAARVHARRPDALFVLAGEGRLIPALQQLAAELGLAGAAHFIGACRRIPELLALSSICALSSRFEGFSNSILEYMAAGRPVVATHAGGAAEAIVDGATGYVVPPGDHETMAARIVSLLEDPALAARMGAAARRRIQDHFTPAVQLRNTLDLYSRLLSPARCRA